jgi:hypothetical protein
LLCSNWIKNVPQVLFLRLFVRKHLEQD